MASGVSSSYSYMQTANNRITGLSGIDTESLVEKLMKAQSAQMEKLQQQKQKYEWQRDAYRDVNTKLSTFRTTIFDKFGLEGSFSSKTVNVSDSSKVSVTATPSATGTLNLTGVSQLATSATKTVSIPKYALSTTLSYFGTDASGTFTYQDPNTGLEKSVDYLNTDTLQTFVTNLQNNGLPNAKIENGQLSLGSDNIIVSSSNNSIDFAQKLGFTFDTNNKITNPTVGVSSTSKLSELGIADGKVTLNVLQADGSVKPTEIAYKSTDTIDSFIANLNTSGAGVTALFANGKMSLTTNATGSNTGGAIAVQSDSNTDAGVFQKLGFLTSASGEIANGQNAKYTVNGLDMESTSNTFTISGYSVTVKDTFDTTSSPVTIASSTNVDAMVDRVKDFVKTYNDLITSLNDKIKEPKNKNYPPLTDAQKSQMTVDQITKWEEQAKSGIIRNDSTIQNALSSLRNTFYKNVEGVDGKYNALFTIGVTTTSVISDGGKLEIDEDKLRKALNSEPDSVMKLFTQSETGVVAQMRTIAQNTVKTIEVTAGKASSVDNTYTLGKQLVDITGRINDWKDRLKDIENRYWSQFTAMENAIQKANSQASYFTQG